MTVRDHDPVFFSKRVKKNDPHIRVPAAVLEPGWAKTHGKNRVDANARGAPLKCH